jgi:hypothetical protein
MMDAIDRPLRDLVTVMELQVQGMDAFQATQVSARDALGAKDWPSLEKALHSLDFQAEGLRCLEERRHFLWGEIQARVLGRTGRVYETLALVPEEFREPLTKLHRELKVRAVNLKGLSQGLAAYVQTAGALIQAVVHELQPALKGRLYSRSGYLRGGDAQPLVLNTHS